MHWWFDGDGDPVRKDMEKNFENKVERPERVSSPQDRAEQKVDSDSLAGGIGNGFGGGNPPAPVPVKAPKHDK